MESLKTIACDIHILACPDDCLDSFTVLAERAGFHLISGDKEDVLSRYCAAIRRFKIDRVIRATGDNPFVFADAGAEINRQACALGADYAGYAGLPHGAGVESVDASALLEAEASARLQPEREHVCPYLYNHPEVFRLHRPFAPREWQASALRVTVDTREDYEKAVMLYEALTEIESPRRYWGKSIIAAAEALG
jgi:spore coat polysaccharide biosynthesis protein SpsF